MVVKTGHLLLWSRKVLSPRGPSHDHRSLPCPEVHTSVSLLMGQEWEKSTELRKSLTDNGAVDRAMVVYLHTIHRASKGFKWHHVHSEVCLADFFPLTQQQPVWMEKGLSHLSCYCLYCFLSPPSVHTVCPQVPPPLPVSADLRISSLDDSSSPWDKRYSRFKCCALLCLFLCFILNKFIAWREADTQVFWGPA